MYDYGGFWTSLNFCFFFHCFYSCHMPLPQAAARQPDGAARRRSVNDSTTRRQSVNHEARQTWVAMVGSCHMILELSWNCFGETNDKGY